mgnify:CR=1 FL=1
MCIAWKINLQAHLELISELSQYIDNFCLEPGLELLIFITIFSEYDMNALIHSIHTEYIFLSSV